MKRYKKYKPSGVEWIGGIPEHWKIIRLKYLSKIENGSTPNTGVVEYWNGEIKWATPVDVSNAKNYLVSDTGKKITKKGFDSCGTTLVEPSSIILTTRAPIGNVAKAGDYICTNQGCKAIHLLKANHSYLFYQLLVSKGVLESLGSGSTFKELSTDALKSFLVCLPSNNEQTTIADYLDNKTAQIDDLIAQKNKLIDLLNEEKTAIINQAVTKGLNPDTPMKDSGIPWMGEIPAHWEIKKIKYIANLTLGKMLTGEDKGGNFLKPYLRAQNISWFKCDTSDVKEMWFSQSDLIKYRVNLNDLLVSEGGDVGRTCIWMNELDECYIQNSVHKITFEKYFNPKYFLYLFYSFGQKGYFLSIVNQISIGHLTGEKLKEVFMIFPGFDEQTAIVDYLDRKTDQMDDVISKTHHEIELLQEYRTALISEAVTGKIKVA